MNFHTRHLTRITFSFHDRTSELCRGSWLFFTLQSQVHIIDKKSIKVRLFKKPVRSNFQRFREPLAKLPRCSFLLHACMGKIPALLTIVLHGEDPVQKPCFAATIWRVQDHMLALGVENLTERRAKEKNTPKKRVKQKIERSWLGNRIVPLAALLPVSIFLM